MDEDFLLSDEYFKEDYHEITNWRICCKSWNGNLELANLRIGNLVGVMMWIMAFLKMGLLSNGGSTKEDPFQATARRREELVELAEARLAKYCSQGLAVVVVLQVLVVQTTFESNIGASKATEASSLLQWREKQVACLGAALQPPPSSESRESEYARESLLASSSSSS